MISGAIRKLADETTVKKALDTPEAKNVGTKAGIEIRYLPPEQLGALVTRETEYWGKIIKSRNITPD